MDVPFVTAIVVAFAYAGVNVFDMDSCGVTSILGISRISINNRLVTQMRFASPQDRNISVLLERRSVYQDDDAIVQDWTSGEGRERHLVSPAKGGV